MLRQFRYDSITVSMTFRPPIAAQRQMSDTNTDDRLIRLETAVAHLQHDLEQMHQALVSLHVEFKGSRDQMALFERRLQQLAEPPETRDPGEERPPHY